MENIEDYYIGTAKLKDEIISEIKIKIQNILNSYILLLNNPETRMSIVATVNNMIRNSYWYYIDKKYIFEESDLIINGYNKKTDDEIARGAATEWCRCFKCDREVRNLISENAPAVRFKCDKSKLATCHQWYNAYRGALLALNMKKNNY